MRRITTVLAALAATALALTGCSIPPATTAEEAQPARISYVHLPDGRVLTCVSTVMRGNGRTFSCDWAHPFSLNGTVPAGVEVIAIDSFAYVKVPSGDTLRCFSSLNSGDAYAMECDWEHPIKPS